MKTFLRLAFVCAIIAGLIYIGLGDAPEGPLIGPVLDDPIAANQSAGQPIQDQQQNNGDVTEAPNTPEPEIEPTIETTTEPATETTIEPTINPSAEPSSESTSEPASELTIEPTIEPTAAPALSPGPEPTLSPTMEPSESPSPEPVQPVADYVPPVIDLPDNIINPYRSSYSSPYGTDGKLSAERQDWSFARADGYQPPAPYMKFDIRQFGGYYLGDITRKAVYLTFDEGYENGFTPAILDTLKAKGVKAAFFLTKPFIEQNPDLCRRMKEEGHIVGNHTVNHLRSSDLSADEMTYEIAETARYFKEITGYDMDMFFRFPEGNYTVRTLNAAQELGYKSVFWSLAYNDWGEQPGKDEAFRQITQYFHNGCILLLHAVSESNTQALADAIDFIRAQGYEFLTLNDLD